MLIKYIQAILHLAKYEILDDDDSFHGELPECNEVFAEAMTLEKCRKQLEEVLDEWILFRVHKNLCLPIIDGIELKIKDAV